MACGGCDEECEGFGGDGAVVTFFDFWKGGGVLHCGVGVSGALWACYVCWVLISLYLLFASPFFSRTGVRCLDTIFFPNGVSNEEQLVRPLNHGYQTKSSQPVRESSLMNSDPFLLQSIHVSTPPLSYPSIPK